MLTHIVIENYRCFEQATSLELGSLALLAGPNGAGKSTVFEMLLNIRKLVVVGESASDLFPEATRTRWGRGGTQRFEMGFRGLDGEYTYRLSIRHGKNSAGALIEREEILHERKLLYSFFKEKVIIHPDENFPARDFPAGNKLSPLSNLPGNVRSKRLDWVMDRISRIWVFRPVPPRLTQLAQREPLADFLEPDLSNFSSWLLSMHKSRPRIRSQLKQSLRLVLEGFSGYNFAPLGKKTSLLGFIFASPHRSSELTTFTFEELSEGQRALVVLYTLLHAVPDDATLCIDEPEEFLSPREIQPWLNLLMEKTEDGGQALLISHNAGLIDLLAPSNGLLLTRPSSGPVHVLPVPVDESGLSTSELLARGWIE